MVPPTQTATGTALPTGRTSHAQPKKATPMARHIPAPRQAPTLAYFDSVRAEASHTLHDHRCLNGRCAAGCPTWPCNPELAAYQRIELLAS